MNTTARSEDAPIYDTRNSNPGNIGEDAVIAQALAILSGRFRPGALMDSPKAVKDYLVLRAAKHDREVFGCLWLDAQHRVLATDDVSFGTLTQASVYPRELARRALALNAAAVILTHNHPSGETRPSRADELLTQTIKATLALVDVRVLDHIITAGAATCSMAENGLV
jgi:DNA repair protein RadC